MRLIAAASVGVLAFTGVSAVPRRRATTAR